MTGPRAPAEPLIATLLIGALGAGCAIAAAGAFRSDPISAGAGGAIAATALVALVAADWIDGLATVILTAPLPALVSNDALRIAAVAPVTGVVVFAWLLRLGALGRGPNLVRLPTRSLFMLALAFVAAAVFATSPATSARELLNVLVLFGFMLLVVDRLNEDRSRIERALALTALVAAACGMLAVLEMVDVIPGAFPRAGTELNRAALGFGQPNGLGLFLAVSAPLAIHVARFARGGARVVAWLAVLVVLLGLFATFSRGSWLALLAGSGLLLFARGGRFALRVWLTALVFALAVDVASGGMLRDTVARTMGDWVIEQRLALQLAGVLMFVDHPVLGVGPGGYALNLDHYGAQIPQLFDYLPTPHNAYVQMAAETGAVGLFAFLAFIVSGAWVALRSAATAARTPEPRTARRIGLRHALLWSFGTAVFAGLVVWPFSHGTGQITVFAAAAAFALAGETS